MVNIIYAFFGTFGVVDALTQGGPGQATKILVFKVYNDGFRGQDLGGSAAQSVILMVIVIAADRRAVPLHRAAGALLRRRWSRTAPGSPFFSHLVLILGVIVDRLSGLDDLRRLDPRPGDDAAPADAAAARARTCSRTTRRC